MQNLHLIPLLVLFATSASAENCRTATGALPDLPTATVTDDQLNFLRQTCPTAATCPEGPYVVRGDRVFIVGPNDGTLICIGYLGRGGSYTEGWVEQSGIRIDG